MSVLTYAEIRNLVAGNAGIPSTSLSTADAGLIDGFLSERIREVWNAAPWPSLRHVSQFTPASRIVSKTVSSSITIGEVRKITDANPRGGSAWRPLAFWDRGATLELDEDVKTCWIDYVEECPASGLTALSFDIRLAHPIVLKGTASFLRARGRVDEGNQFSGLGDAALRREVVLVQRSAEP